MTINLATTAADAALDAVGKMMDGGAVELLSGSGSLLATLRLSDPAAQPAADGELELNAIDPGKAVLTGKAEFARVVGRDGLEVFSCDVGDVQSTATIKLSPPFISYATTVQLKSFKLMMP